MRDRTATRHAARKRGIQFERDPGSRTPFKRVIALMQDMERIMSQDQPFLQNQFELSLLPPYRSRGHGGRHKTKNQVVGNHQDRNPGRYDPAREDRKHARMVAR